MGAALPCSAWASHCGGFSYCGAQALGHGISICGTWASLPCFMWTPPGAGIKPTSPELAGRLSTIGPPGKSEIIALNEPHQCKGPYSY